MCSNVSEEAHVTGVRVLKWNEKLENNAHQKYMDDGFFVFLIASEFTLNGSLCDCGILDEVMLFPLASLQSPLGIEKMVRNTLGLLSTHLLSETIHNLGSEISNYLENHFRFELDIRVRAPMSVIVVEVYRTRNIVYDQEILHGGNIPLFPTWEADDLMEFIRDLNGDVALDVNELVRRTIRSAIGLEELLLGQDSVVGRKPIVDDEPVGLVQVSSVVVLQLIGVTGCKMVGRSCPICLVDFSSDEWAILETPCSHIFHAKCINQWLSRRHSCPMCRFQLP